MSSKKKKTVKSTSSRSKLSAGVGSDHHKAAALGMGTLEDLKQGKLTVHFRNSAIIPSPKNPRRRSLDEAGVTREVVDKLSFKEGELFEGWYERVESYIKQLDDSVKGVWLDLLELATSIHKRGILQPIVINTKNMIVAGERRWTAALLAGKPTSPVITREFNEVEEEAFRLLENLQRTDLTLGETVGALRGVLSLAFGECAPDNEKININEIVNIVGVGRTTAAAYRAFCRLPEGDPMLNAILNDEYTNIKTAYTEAAERVRLMQAGVEQEDIEVDDEKEKPEAASKEPPARTPTARISIKVRPSARKLIDVFAKLDGITEETSTQIKELSSEWANADDSRRSELLRLALDMALTHLEASSEEN